MRNKNSTYIIVSSNNKLVFDAFDDERIFSINDTGTKRGCRFALFGERTLFGDLVSANKGIDAIKSHGFVGEYRAVSLVELKNTLPDRYNEVVDEMAEFDKKKKRERAESNCAGAYDAASSLSDDIISANTDFGNAEYGWLVGRVDGIKEAVEFILHRYDLQIKPTV